MAFLLSEFYHRRHLLVVVKWYILLLFHKRKLLITLRVCIKNFSIHKERCQEIYSFSFNVKFNSYESIEEIIIKKNSTHWILKQTIFWFYALCSYLVKKRFPYFFIWNWTSGAAKMEWRLIRIKSSASILLWIEYFLFQILSSKERLWVMPTSISDICLIPDELVETSGTFEGKGCKDSCPILKLLADSRWGSVIEEF